MRWSVARPNAAETKIDSWHLVVRLTQNKNVHRFCSQQTIPLCIVLILLLAVSTLFATFRVNVWMCNEMVWRKRWVKPLRHRKEDRNKMKRYYYYFHLHFSVFCSRFAGCHRWCSLVQNHKYKTIVEIDKLQITMCVGIRKERNAKEERTGR